MGSVMNSSVFLLGGLRICTTGLLLSHKHLCLQFGHVTAVAMLFPYQHTDGKDLYPCKMLQETPRAVLAMNHKTQLLHPTCSMATPQYILLDQFAPFSNPYISAGGTATKPMLGKCQ